MAYLYIYETASIQLCADVDFFHIYSTVLYANGFNLFCIVIYTTLKIKLTTYAKITERTSVKLKEVYLGRD